MMYLNKNSINTVILELTCVSSLLNSNYLFELTSDINPSSITYFTSPDLSTYKCRYNRFTIIESGASYTDSVNGIVNLRSGSYTYKVYESSAVTTSISATTGKVISTDKAYVNGIDNDLPSIYR